MNVPKFARLAARVLRARVAQPKRVPEPFIRERGIATIERALIERRRRHWRTRMGFALAAAMVLGGIGFLAIGHGSMNGPMNEDALAETVVSVEALPLGDGATVVRAHGGESLERGVRLEAGDRVATRARGGALLNLSTGTRLQLGGGTHFVVQSEGPLQRYSLDQGVLDAQVTHLHAGQRFVVDTLDAQVEVRGTAFRLLSLSASTACDGGVRTRVEVRDGAVEVRSAGQVFLVEAGQNWPAECGRVEASEEAEVPETEPTLAQEAAKSEGPVLSGPPSRRSRGDFVEIAADSVADPYENAGSIENAGPLGSAGDPSRVETSQRSVLSEQTKLFARGLAEQRRGDVSSALRSYAELSVKYPKSPLAENAMVERMRLLSRRNHEAARQEAERYLARYANGFARHEAQLLLGRQ